MQPQMMWMGMQQQPQYDPNQQQFAAAPYFGGFPYMNMNMYAGGPMMMPQPYQPTMPAHIQQIGGSGGYNQGGPPRHYPKPYGGQQNNYNHGGGRGGYSNNNYGGGNHNSS